MKTNSSQKRATVLGNSVVDVFFELPSKFTHSKDGVQEIILPVGEKLSASDYSICAGGSGANVAAGLDRADMDVDLYTEVNDDVFGRHIQESLGPRIRFHNSVTKHPTSTSVVLRTGSERTIITAHYPQGRFPEGLSSTGAIYLGPIHVGAGDFCERLVDHVCRSHQLLCVNPSIDMIMNRRADLLTILRKTEILFVNAHEAQQLTHVGSNAKIHERMRSLHELGPRIVCLTVGENGAYAGLAQGQLFRALAMVGQFPAVDATGAGDSFASGFTSRYLVSESIQEALAAGIINSASVVGKVGGQAGLLSGEAIDNYMKFVDISQA